MPTPQQRMITIAEAELNRVLTAAEKTKLGEAWAMQLQPGATNEQVAKEYLRRHRQMDLDQINAKTTADKAAADVATNNTTFVEAAE